MTPEKDQIITEMIRESLRDWFKKEDWVRIDTQGNITGKCGTMKNKKVPSRCLPRKKAQAMTIIVRTPGPVIKTMISIVGTPGFLLVITKA